MSTKNKTIRYQSNFAKFCRSGVLPENLIEVRKDNVAKYRELTFNIIYDSIDNSYPLTSNLLDNEIWEELIHSFFATHDCKTPKIWQMPFEFYEYIKNSNFKVKDKFPFLTDLLFFEWLELELFLMDDIETNYQILPPSETGNNGLLLLNPETQVHQLDYPVHIKNAKKIKATDKKKYFVSAYRVPENGEVRFMDLSPAYVYILDFIQLKPSNVSNIYIYLKNELQIELTPSVKKNIDLFINNGIKKRLILNCKTL